MSVDNTNYEQIPEDIANLSFEDAYSELKEATEKLESEEIDLEATLEEYGRASALWHHCANLLDDADERIKVLIESEGIMKLTRLDERETD